MPDTAIEPPFEAYRGDAPYVFVSYAHVNGKSVFAHLTYLKKRGYRIWFDEGIDPGSEWGADIERALAGASAFIVFVTPQSVKSRNVRNEINFALDQKIPFFAIHLTRTELPAGIELQIGRKQALMAWRMKPSSYATKIGRMLPTELIDPSVDPALAGPPPLRPPANWFRPAAIALGLVIAVAGAAWLAPKWLGESGNPPNPEPAGIQKVQPPELRWDTEARDFLDSILDLGWDTGFGRMVYSDIVLAGEQGKTAELLLDGRFTRDGRFYKITLDRDGRWTSQDLPKEDAFREWREFGNYHRSVEGADLQVPRFELAKLSNPQLKIEKRGDQFFLAGTVDATPLADVVLRAPILMVEIEVGPREEGKTSIVTQLVPLRIDTVPDGLIKIETELNALQDGHRRDWENGVTFWVESFALMGNPKTYVVTNALKASVDLQEYQDVVP